MSFDIKGYEDAYPTCSQIYKYFTQSFLGNIYCYFKTYEIIIDSVPFNMRKIYDDSRLRNRCDKFMQELKNVKNNNDHRTVFCEYDSVLKTEILNTFFKRDQNLEALELSEKLNRIEQLEKEKRDLQEMLELKENELKDEKNKKKFTGEL